MIEKFKKYLELEKRYSGHTVTAYIKDLEQFYAYLNLPKDQIPAESTQIRQWVVELMNEEVNKASINRKLSTLKTFYKYLLRNEQITVNPMDKVISPKMPKRLPEFVPETDMEKIDEIFGNDFVGLRDRLIIEMFYMTGIRRSELLNLKHIDIDFYSKNIKVLGKRQKERLIPVSDYLLSLTKEYEKEKNKIENCDKAYLLVTNKGTKLYEGLIYKIVKKYLTLITTVHKKSPHILRHTFATHLLNNGADLNAIKELLGHANLSATQVYTHNSFEKINKIYKQTHPRG